VNINLLAATACALNTM